MNWELVVFDCDGTLVDSERIANEVFARLITAEGLATSFEECVARYMGRSTSACLELIEARLGRAVSADLGAVRTRMVDERLAELRAVPGMAELLGRVAAAGVPMCVASSSTPAEIEFRLRRTGLAEYFGDNLFSATTVPNGKPAPDVYLLAAERLGVDPGRCVVVEDSPVGVRGAVAAGMHVVGFADLIEPELLRDAGAHEVVREPAELGRFLLPE